jgi:hypothetical protein
MRVKLCTRCPYTPHDLAGHYDPDAAFYACAKCDAIFDSRNLGEAYRRRQWPTIPPTISSIPQRVVPSATDDSASSATTPGAPLCAQGSASIASRPAETATPDGCANFSPRDDRHRTGTAVFGGSAFQNREPAE